MLTLGVIFCLGCFAVVGAVIVGFIPACLIKGVIEYIKERKHDKKNTGRNI